MKKSIFKAIAVLLLVCMCMSLAACGVKVTTGNTSTNATNAQGTVTSAAAASNLNLVSSYADLTKAQTGIILNDAPSGSQNVTYGWMNNIPVIDEITFNYNGYNYVYRAAACPGGVASADISGVTKELKGVSTVNLTTPNEAGGSYVLRYDPTSGEGVANWTSTLSKCQYSLYTNGACLGDVQNMPMTQVMRNLYVAAPDVKTVAGNTVLATSNNTLTITTAAGATAVIDCSNISTLNVATQDIVDLVYTGDLAGNAYAIKITKSGQAAQSTGPVISGTIYQLDSSRMFLQTADSNVYILLLSGSTKVTGAASSLVANQEVKVSYTGDLNTGATATAVEVVKQGNGATPAPASSTYVDKTVTGYVTSVAGNYVTVQGILFTVNKSYCYVSGTAQVGTYATVNYRDYGNSKREVTSAYFGTTPTPSSYTNRICCGYITYANGIYIGVEGGYDFVVNGANCYVSGTAEVGGYARIDYKDYGYGSYEVTSAVFTPKEKDIPELCTAYGTVDSYSGSSVSVGGVSYTVTYDTYVTGTAEQRGTATVWYNKYSDGRRIATSIEFYPAYDPQEDYSLQSSYGTVDSYPGSTVSIGGVSYTIAYDTIMNGTPEQRGTATVWYKQYSDGRRIATQIDFYPAYVSPEDPLLGQGDLIDEEFSAYYGQGDLIDEQFSADYGQGDLIDDEFAVGY